MPLNKQTKRNLIEIFNIGCLKIDSTHLYDNDLLLTAMADIWNTSRRKCIL